MDPATAFQLACGAITLVDFGIRTARDLYEIWESSASMTADNVRLEQETLRLEHANTRLKTHLSNVQGVDQKLTLNQRQLKAVVLEIDRLTSELLCRLARLRSTGRRRKRDVPGLYVKSLRERPGIRKIQAQLEKQQKMLDTSMLINLW